MTTKATYDKADLEDARWKRKREKILAHADYRCQTCGVENAVLHVHHSYYKEGLRAWEYPDGSLVALCEDCHGRVVHGINEKPNSLMPDELNAEGVFNCFTNKNHNDSAQWVRVFDFLRRKGEFKSMDAIRGEIHFLLDKWDEPHKSDIARALRWLQFSGVIDTVITWSGEEGNRRSTHTYRLMPGL